MHSSIVAAAPLTKKEIVLILAGGAGMWMINSVHGLSADYWNVVTGAWAFGLSWAWYCYGDAVIASLRS